VAVRRRIAAGRAPEILSPHRAHQREDRQTRRALFSVSGRDLADFPAFLAMFCLGSLIGSLSGVPIGLGVLEATMLSLRFDAQVHETAAALIVYRAVYFAGPALLAAIALGGMQLADFGRRRVGTKGS
jgi:hypothetical protein